MKKILTIVGARPQFIKAAPLSRVLRTQFEEIMLHTGQHYDYEMSKVFFDQLGIPEPDINLNVGSASHGKQTAHMIIGIEDVILQRQPHLVLIYGDTNSTLSAAIAASKLHVPIAHVEAGLRNFDKNIPEEVNRLVADKLSSLLFAPTTTAVYNLRKEGIIEEVYQTGDVMLDSLLYNLDLARTNSTLLSELKVKKKDYYLVTIHRAENTDNITNLESIILALNKLNKKVIFPIHPRTRKIVDQLQKYTLENIYFIKPAAYLDFLNLENNALKIITDSGGVQKEAYCLKIPCVTIFPSSSWPETINDGWNTLVNANTSDIVSAVHDISVPSQYNDHYGDGTASVKISRIITEFLNR
jgi:UDP-N-acetylglucosamine 2-epimerase